MPEPVIRPNRQQSRRRSTDPDYHDPTAGFMGAPPAFSALNLRLMLAAFGVVVCIGGAIAFAVAGLWLPVVLLVLLAIGAIVNLVVVNRRRAAVRRL